MAKDYYILRDDRGWWAVSDGPFVPDSGRSFPSYKEAVDQTRNLLESKGLVMGKTYPEDTGFRVEALRPGEVAPEEAPMLYSAAALHTAEAIRDSFGRRLKQRALDIAKREGRKLITGDDVWAAYEELGKAASPADLDEEVGDE